MAKAKAGRTCVEVALACVELCGATGYGERELREMGPGRQDPRHLRGDPADPVARRRAAAARSVEQSTEVTGCGAHEKSASAPRTYRTNGNLILSAAPLHVLQEAGAVDEAGEITASGAAAGVQKDSGRHRGGILPVAPGRAMASPHAAGVGLIVPR